MLPSLTLNCARLSCWHVALTHHMPSCLPLACCHCTSTWLLLLYFLRLYRWRSFQRGGAVALYVALYALGFMASSLHTLAGGIPVLIYTCYMAILITGGGGMYSSVCLGVLAVSKLCRCFSCRPFFEAVSGLGCSMFFQTPQLHAASEGCYVTCATAPAPSLLCSSSMVLASRLVSPYLSAHMQSCGKQ